MRLFYEWPIASRLLTVLAVWVLTATQALGQQKAATQTAPAASLTGSGSVSISTDSPSPCCVNTPIAFTAHGSGCIDVNWSIAEIPDFEASGPSFTYTFTTAGQYTIQVTADCGSPASATKTIVVVDPPAPQPITYTSVSGNVRQLSPANVVICEGDYLDLTPPSGSTAWAWTGDPLPTTSTGSVRMNSIGGVRVTPTAASTIYTVSYLLPSSPCRVSSSFTVNLAMSSPLFKVLNTERFGTGTLTLTISEPGQNIDYAWYNSGADITNLATGNGQTFTTPTLLGSRTFSLGTTSCAAESRGVVDVTVRFVRILVNSNPPAAPVPLVYSADGTGGPSVVLLAQTSSAYTGQYTWERNGVPLLNETSAQLRATLAGRYVVRITGTGSDYDSSPVDVVEPLDGQMANGQPLTYVNEVNVSKPGVTNANEVKQLSVADRLQTVTYANGFGQPMQQVAVQAGPGQQDIIQHVGYAGEATAAQTYLPFPVPAQNKTPGTYEQNAVTQLTAYYVTKGGLPYTTTTSEASPLGRPLDQTQAGLDWAGHTNNVEYDVNESNEVHMWEGFDGTQFYPPGQLSKEVRRDPDNRETQIYKDQFGRVVLQRKVTTTANAPLDTYNLYDAAGRLQAVVPPAAVQELDKNGQWNINQLPAPSSFQERWLFQYTYDERGRLISRQFPGAAPVYLVYDPFDRPVLVQDGNHRAVHQWLFTKFDALNRPVVEGIYTDGSSRIDLQSQADAATSFAEFENRISNGYTTTNTFPSITEGSNGNGTLLSLTFYDDYDLNKDGTRDYFLKTESRISPDEQPVEATQIRGLTTITRRRVVQPGGQYGDWLTTVFIYDQYGNVVQKYSNNLLQPSPELQDVTTLVYRSQGFVPQILRSIKRQSYGPVPQVVVRNRYTYDPAGRPLQTWQQHEWQQTIAPEVLLSSNRYEGLGELTQKRLHSRDGVKFLQYEDFAYDLHGQLKRINQSNLSSNAENDLFGMELVREIPNFSSLSNTARFDGGISAISWSTHNPDQLNQPERERSYIFDYDDLGRLNAATFAARKLPGTGWTMENGAYDERNLTYDANGNMLSVERHTQRTALAPVETTDDMFLFYGNGNTASNQLVGAYDYQWDPRGFANTTTSRWDDYKYDQNGSIVHDGNKGVDYTFNALNKVEQQQTGTGTIRYTYDAAGTVIKRETDKGAGVQTEYYIDGFVYEYSPTFTGLRSVPTPEGRALVVQQVDQTLTYEYHLRDHLGNMRVAFRAQAGTEELRLSSEGYPTQEEGPYPKFENVTVTQSQATSAKDGDTVAAVTITSGTATNPGGPAIAVPVSDGDHIQIKVYCKTPYGVQYFRSAPPAPLWPKAAVALAVAPTLLPNLGASTVDGRPTPRTYPGLQLNVTGLLSALAAKPRGAGNNSTAALQPGGGGSPGSTPLNAYVVWTLRDSKGQTIRSGNQVVPVYNDNDWHPVNLSLDIDLSSDDARRGTLRIQEVNEASNPVFFDLLTITHPQDQALVSQENHYYPLGLPMSGVAVNTVPADVISKQQFNSGSDLQDEVLGAEGGVYSTFYRTYDPATGRFTGVDPLADSFADQTPYQFGNNDPINFNDPSGALSDGGGGFWEWLINLFIPNGPGHQNIPVGNLSYGNGGPGGGAKDYGPLPQFPGGSFGSLSSIHIGGASNAFGVGGSQGGPISRGGGPANTSWALLYKKDLNVYFYTNNGRNGTSNELGTLFEDLFEQSIPNGYWDAFNTVANIDLFVGSGSRNTIPDFIADVYYMKRLMRFPYASPERVPGGAWLELKAKGGGLYLSSNQGQVTGHILNLAVEQSNNISTKPGYNPLLMLITTADVPYSRSIASFANSKKVSYAHFYAEYRIVNNVYEFRFIRPTNAGLLWRLIH